MKLVDFSKKKSNATPETKVTIKTSSHAPTRAELSVQLKFEAKHRFQNYQVDEAGLYPYEILMLSYVEGYAKGKTIARFWEYQYGVDDVPALIASLERRGFCKDGSLTDAGRAEIAKNEYVLYMHRHKYTEISMEQMAILVNQNPDRNYRDLIWAEFNRLSGEYAQSGRFGLYRNTRYSMYRFLMEEKRYKNAFYHLAETVFYDLNGDSSPFMAPAIIKDLRSIQKYLDFSDVEMQDFISDSFRNIYAPYRNFSAEEVAAVVAAYSFGHDKFAEKLIKSKSKW